MQVTGSDTCRRIGLHIDEPYALQAVLTESFESFCPSIRGGAGFAEVTVRPPMQPTCNAIVVVAASVKPTGRTIGLRSAPPASGDTNGYSQHGMRSGWCRTRKPGTIVATVIPGPLVGDTGIEPVTPTVSR